MHCKQILPIVLLCLGISSAQPPMKGPPGGNRSPVIAPFGPPQMGENGHMPPPMIMDVTELASTLAEIGIAPSKIEKISGITRDFISGFNKNILAIQRKELDIKEELFKEKPDLKKIRNSISEKTRFFAEIEFAQIKRDLDIKAQLTRDEYDKLKSLTMKKFKAMMPEGMRNNKPHPDKSKQPPVAK